MQVLAATDSSWTDVDDPVADGPVHADFDADVPVGVLSDVIRDTGMDLPLPTDRDDADRRITLISADNSSIY